jgi:glutathione peroxidase
MNKVFVTTLLLLLSCTAFSQNSNTEIKQIHISALNGTEIDMSKFSGEKIILYTIDASSPDISVLTSLDSLYKNAHGKVVVIGIPINDFGKPKDNNNLSSLLRDSLKLSYPITSIGKGKRGDNQHKLMQWLMSKSPKSHFDIELKEAGGIFIISTKGILYAVLNKTVHPTSTIMMDILANEPVE